MTADTIRIGTRGSQLALWQAHWVRDRLAEAWPGLLCTVEIIKTTGDRILDAPLSKIGDKGLFTREIEHALIEKSIDLAVHSLKDLPTELPQGLMIGAVTEREDVRDVFLPRPGSEVRTLTGQPPGASVATGSLRRTCQVLHHRPDLIIVDLRGNLNTRWTKLGNSSWGGMLLARAGVVRLGWADRIGETLDPLQVLPAVGQGALGIEVREDDLRVQEVVHVLHHEPTWQATAAERALLHALEGGCQIPIGTFARMEVGKGGEPLLVLDAMVGSLDGSRVIRVSGRRPPGEARLLGEDLAGELLRNGARSILASIRGTSDGSTAA